MSSSQEQTNPILVIAIPTTDGRLCAHFGHCEQFALFDLDMENRRIVSSRQLAPPLHQPGVLPRWLHDQGVNLAIAGGLGQRAADIFAEQGIDVIVGATVAPPEQLVQTYLDGTLQPGTNPCDH